MLCCEQKKTSLVKKADLPEGWCTGFRASICRCICMRPCHMSSSQILMFVWFFCMVDLGNVPCCQGSVSRCQAASWKRASDVVEKCWDMSPENRYNATTAVWRSGCGVRRIRLEVPWARPANVAPPWHNLGYNEAAGNS